MLDEKAAPQLSVTGIVRYAVLTEVTVKFNVLWSLQTF
jgi:hypothetical protein